MSEQTDKKNSGEMKTDGQTERLKKEREDLMKAPITEEKMRAAREALASAAAGVLAVANVARGGGLAATLVLGGAAAMLGLLTASEVKELRRTGR